MNPARPVSPDSSPLQPAGQELVTLRPHRRQFVVSQLPFILLFAALVVIPGIPGLVPAQLSRTMLLIAVPVGVLLMWRYAYLRAMRYDISDDQIIYRHGLLCARRDYVELYRVVDYEERQNILQMLLGLKTVSVLSQDRTTPRLDITGVRSDINVVRVIRERVEYNKKKKGVYEITNR